MSHEITIAQAAERAHQAEVLCLMLETYPNQMADSELTAIATLLRHLTGDVSVWLIEEQAQREAKA